MRTRIYYNGNRTIYINEGFPIQNILKGAAGIKSKTKSFVQGIKNVKQNVLNKAKSVIRGTRRTIGVGIKITSLAPYATGSILKGINKGITIADRYISNLNRISKSVQQKGSNIIRYGSKIKYRNNSKIKKIYGSSAIALGRIIQGFGTTIKIPALATNAIKNISQGTIKPLGHLYTKYGDIMFKIGNKIDTVKHRNIKEFLK